MLYDMVIATKVKLLIVCLKVQVKNIRDGECTGFTGAGVGGVT